MPNILKAVSDPLVPRLGKSRDPRAKEAAPQATRLVHTDLVLVSMEERPPCVGRASVRGKSDQGGISF